jgi:SAM-dependent methyltransferase/DNA-directed RNA polymerase subunit RPC12/RpoP
LTHVLGLCLIGDVRDPVRESLLSQLQGRYRCPACHAPISWDDKATIISCNSCSARYPLLQNRVPVLLVNQRQTYFAAILNEDPGGKAMVREYRRYGSWRARIRNALRPPSIVYDEELARKYSWIYDTRGLETLVLSIGGGPGRENPRVINLNLDAFDSVDIVADGANLPLIDGAVDTITCNAVIEHVPNPHTLVEEVCRVLKPGGYAQLMVPFVFPFHAYPRDFQRYTAAGILELTRCFEKVELNVLSGPTSAMLVMLREYLHLLFPGGNAGVGRMLLNGISGWMTFPFKYLDRWINHKPDAANLAAAFYFLGRKPS